MVKAPAKPRHGRWWTNVRRATTVMTGLAVQIVRIAPTVLTTGAGAMIVRRDLKTGVMIAAMTAGVVTPVRPW